MDKDMGRAPFIIGIAGGTGSGKTTVSQKLQAAVGKNRIAYLQHDSYYHDQSGLPPEQRARVNYDHPDSLDTALLIEHLHKLRAWQPVEVPIYDFATHSRTSRVLPVLPAPIILVEGILIFVDAELRQMLDIRIYVETDADIRFIRRLQRDIEERGRSLESVVTQYLETVRPMHMEFVESSKRFADVIVPEGGNNQVAMAMIVSRVLALLAECEP